MTFQDAILYPSMQWVRVFICLQEEGSIYHVSDQNETIVRMHFVKFETKFIETCLDFIQDHMRDSNHKLIEKSIKVTGGGAYKYTDLISSKLGVE